MIRWLKQQRVKRELLRRFDKFAAMFPGSEISLITEAGGILALVATLPAMPLSEFNRRWPEHARQDDGGEIIPTFRDEFFNPRTLSGDDKLNLAAGLDYCRDLFDEWRKAR